MNENIDLTRILKDCPKGTKLYSPLFGEVFFEGIICGSSYSIKVRINGGEYNDLRIFTSDGRFFDSYKEAECLLFPSKENRDWSKFIKSKGRKVFQPFERVLVAEFADYHYIWTVALYSHWNEKLELHVTAGGYHYKDDGILPYKGNECLLGNEVKE